MKIRFLSVVTIAVLLLNVVSFAAGDTRRAKVKTAQTGRLVAMLPASDGIAVFDSKRFLGEALPKVLSANQPMLSGIMAKITEMETRTGIDLRKFEQVAVGLAMKQISPTNIDFEPVAIASGDINAGALIAVAKLASKGAYREEKIGERGVYIFNVKDVMQKGTITTTNSKVGGVVDNALKGLTKEIAVTMLDRNTLVLGSLGRVRETLDGTSHISPDLTSLLSPKETSVMSFAFKTPAGAAKMIPLDNDELGANIDAIQYIAGSLDVAAIGTSLQMVAKTRKREQAAGLKDTLEGLQMVGKAILGGSKRADQQVYARMLRNARISTQGTDVTFDLLVPQADIDVLIAGIK